MISEVLQEKAVVKEGLDYLRSCEEEYVELIAEITQVPAPSNEEDQRSEYLEKKMRSMGFPFVARDEVGNVLAFFPGKDHKKTVISMAHMDTVFPFDTDLTVKRDGNILAAPGVSDNSASLACMLLLGKIFKQHLPLEHPVVLVSTVGEEGLGDLKGARFFCDNIENYDFGGFRIHPENVVFLNIDGGMGYIVNGGVGSRRLRVDFKGQGGHSWGSFGNTNAIYGIGVAIANISRIQVPESPRTTYNVGVVQGGHSVNSIAQDAHMLLDMRSVDAKCLVELEEEIMKCLLEAASSTGTEYTIAVVGDRPTGEIPVDCAYIQGLMELGKECGYDLTVGYSSTDSNIPLSRGWPAVTMGFKRSENGHKTTEFLYIDSLVPGIQFALMCFAGLLYDQF
ncbi:MAG: M20/M25/M40 family metallo-hydrolase [Firmicutes bacterium]|nr:M20/M25/M40 family metallo-hydrolase [Candidatus Fermentithermobacillaceae bacterium]